jgi:hypothetical protein
MSPPFDKGGLGGRVEGRKRGPNILFVGDLTPGGAQGGRHDDIESRDSHSEAAGDEIRVTSRSKFPVQSSKLNFEP